MLICRVRTICAALALNNVVETMRPLPVEPFAGAPSFVRGLAVIRGAPTPVVDLGLLLGCREPAEPTRFVTLAVGERRVAVAVEGVEGMREFASDAAQELPPLLKDASAGAVAAVRALDAELMVVLSAARVIPEQVWRELAKKGGSP